MIQITATTAAEMVKEDYRHNFMPRAEFGLTLTFEQMAEVLKDSEIETGIHLSPQFNFYLQQVFIASWKEISKSHSIEQQQKMVHILKDVTMYDHLYEIKTLPVLIELTFFPHLVSEHDLYDVFKGLKSMDMYCMHLAYKVWFTRKNPGGVPFEN